jgi:hypothetical protein
LTAGQIDALRTLVSWLDEQGFEGLGQSITDELTDGTTLPAMLVLLGHVARDVWWHFNHVGEDHERPLYAAVETEILRVRSALVSL